MSIDALTRARRLIALSVAIGASAAAFVLASSRSSEVREVRITIRAMAFYADGEQSNPTLRLKRGEQVKIVLESEDAGMNHDFAIEAWGVRTTLLNGKGRTEIALRVPDEAQTIEYHCTPHRVMMRGTIQVE
jgi:plastocyanin